MSDPLLPPDGDYPTDEIDVWPMLAEDAPAEAFAVKDSRGQTHLHGKGTGRFVRPTRMTVLRTFGEGQDATQMPVRVFTWAEVQKMAESDPNGPNLFEYPDEPGVEWVTTTYAPGVVSCRPANSDTYVKVETKRDRKPIPPDPATIRAWAQRNGFPVNSRGKLPQAVITAYIKARG